MKVSVYRYGSTERKARFSQVIDYNYKKMFVEIGTFSMRISESAETVRKISTGDILYVEEAGKAVADSLYVTSILNDDKICTLKGYDMKFLLSQRITLFPMSDVEAGTYGYDVQTGYTGDIIKHYIDYNLCEASDPNRRLSGSYCVTEPNIGISNDSYMSRLEPLNQVVETLCSSAGIGYDVFYDVYTGEIGINIIAGRNLTGGGYAFSTYIGNMSEFSQIVDTSAEKTVAWVVNGTGTDNATVKLVAMNNAIGIDRKETVVTANCDTDLVDLYAQKSCESMAETRTVEAETETVRYGAEFNIGDFIYVQSVANVMRVVSVEKNYTAATKRLKVGFSEYIPSYSGGSSTNIPKRVLNRMADEGARSKKDVIDAKLDGGGGGSGGETVTIDHAIILREEAAKYLLREYDYIEYDSGVTAVYSEVGPYIIVNGCAYYPYNKINFVANQTDINDAFPDGVPTTYDSGEIIINSTGGIRMWRIAVTAYYPSSKQYQNYIEYSTNGGETWTRMSSYIATYAEPLRVFYSYEVLYGKYVYAYIQTISRNYNGIYVIGNAIGTIANTNYRGNSYFKDTIEHDAAIGLTYVPNKKTAVTVTETEYP